VNSRFSMDRSSSMPLDCTIRERCMRINFAGSSSGGQTRLHRLKAQLDSIEQWFWTANYVAWEAEAIAEMLQKPFPASS
jgi:hypothetical protein